jgi:predicted HicB family RNase H-like nuclease
MRRPVTCPPLRATPAEKAQFEAAAAAADLSLSAWMRQVLLRESGDGDPAALEVPVLEEAQLSIRVPVSEAELEAMKVLAKAAGISLGRWARAALRRERPQTARPSLEAQELVDQLRRIGTNLNQLTRLANGGQLGAADGRRLLEVLGAVAGTVEELEVRVVKEGR